MVTWLYISYLSQIGDLRLRVAQLAENIVGVLTRFGSRGADAGWRALQVHAVAKHVHLAQYGMLHRRAERQALHLLVLEALLHVVDRPRRHARLGQDAHPFSGVTRDQEALDCLVEGRAVLIPRGPRLETI